METLKSQCICHMVLEGQAYFALLQSIRSNVPQPCCAHGTKHAPTSATNVPKIQKTQPQINHTENTSWPESNHPIKRKNDTHKTNHLTPHQTIRTMVPPSRCAHDKQAQTSAPMRLSSHTNRTHMPQIPQDTTANKSCTLSPACPETIHTSNQSEPGCHNHAALMKQNMHQVLPQCDYQRSHAAKHTCPRIQNTQRSINDAR